MIWLRQFRACRDSRRFGKWTGVSPILDNGRAGQTNPVIIVLLTLILAAILVLIGVLIWGGDGGGGGRGGNGNVSGGISGGTPTPQPTPRPAPKPKPVAVQSDVTVTREAQPIPPAAPPKPVAKPQRIKETLQAGKTYRIVIKEGLQSRVEDSDWGVKAVVNVTYAGEHEILRKIESNDGHRIVELRQFVASRNIKVLSEVEQAKLDLGVRGSLVLVALEYLVPGTLEAVAVAKPVFDQIFKDGAQALLNDESAKLMAAADSLTGKQIRIVYVDGTGVESLTPVGCTLTEDERDFIFDTAVLSDCYIMPEIDKKPGESWTVAGSQFAFLFDPSWRGRPVGDIVLKRDKDQNMAGHTHAILKVDRGVVTVNATDQSTKRMGTFTPTGQMHYSLVNNHVDGAMLKGMLTVEELSQDHLLFPAVFKATPSLTIDYFCEILP